MSERKKLRRRDKKVLGMSVCACVMGKEKYRETERKIKCFLYIMEGEGGGEEREKESEEQGVMENMLPCDCVKYFLTSYLSRLICCFSLPPFSRSLSSCIVAIIDR